MLGTLPKRLQNASNPKLVGGGLVAAIALSLILISGSQPETAGSMATGLGGQPLTVLALLAFVGGVVSFASPCTLPILPAYFAFATQSGRGRIAANTMAFMLGVATMFSLLGASASALGRFIIQSQELLLLIGGAIVMVFGVMSLLGKGFTGVGRKQESVSQATAGSSYIFGLSFSLGWSSCVGPILGVVLTLAASTGSVSSGFILLFIYALGLGLPLIVVSTFFGRASRQSLFWRLLRGKGWSVRTHTLVIGLVWSFAIWRVLAAFIAYAFDNVALFAGQQFSATHEFGLLAIVIAGAALWIYSKSGQRRSLLQLHTTQAFSGLLFVLMAILMLNGTLAEFNELIPTDLAIWFSGIEDRLIAVFS